MTGKDRTLNPVEYFCELEKRGLLAEDELPEILAMLRGTKSIRDQIFMHDIYKMTLPVMGIAIEFGCRWGQNLMYWIHLRGIYEPQNWTRQIVAFDTFEGFLEVSEIDIKANSEKAKEGHLSVPKGYEDNLEQLLKLAITNSRWQAPAYFAGVELIKGDACETFPKYLEDNPSTTRR